jgi:hypothetical protein
MKDGWMGKEMQDKGANAGEQKRKERKKQVIERRRYTASCRGFALRN